MPPDVRPVRPVSPTPENGLPAGWLETRLLDITRHHSGNSKLIKGKLQSEAGNGLFPAFSATGQDVWRDGFESEGDAIIVSAVGARCGKCFLASGKWSAIANTHVVWPKPEAIDRKFLWYRINDEQFWIRSGTAQPFVVVRKTFERPFPLPPLPEQRRIVAEIEKQFTRLEAGVAALRRVQANLHRYRAAVLKAACEGRLVENGSKWQHRKLGELTTKIGSGSTPRGGEEIYRDSGIPLIRSMNVHSTGFRFDGLAYIDDAEAKKLDHVTVTANDVLLNITGASIGRVTTAPASLAGARVNQHVCIIRPKKELLPAFLAMFLASPIEQARVMNVQVGATRQALTKAMVTNWEVPLPPVAEQERIVAEVERRLSVVEELSALVTANLQRATRLRQSILQQAFEGKLSSSKSPIKGE